MKKTGTAGTKKEAARLSGCSTSTYSNRLDKYVWETFKTFSIPARQLFGTGREKKYPVLTK
jgi:hypothetical protein